MKAEEFKTQYLEKIYKEYSDTRSKSKYLFQEAQNYLPGGDTRTVTFFRPFPSFMVRGEGFNLYDVDGNEYIDFFNNATSLVLGHAHPKVVNAVLEQVKCGSVFASPLACQTKLAKILCDRLPSADRVRFCNSGTEATLTAIRAARAYRKKYKIMKMEGGYNGSCDLVEISVKPDLRKAGSINEPNAVPEDDSVSPGTLGECVIAPFNEPEIVSRLIEKHHDDLAAVIIEPMQGSCGMIPADFDFLKVCRDITTHFDIPLIFDEVQSFRLSPGGFQEICGVTPDITILGKIIGGGYPVGGVAGNKKYMDQFSPLNSSFLTHSGTFNGNPVTMVAGIATLSELQHSEIERINSLGANLREEFVRIAKGKSETLVT